MKGANNLNARLVAFQGKMDSGDCSSISPFHPALLGSLLCQFEKMTKSPADKTEKELEAKQSLETWSCPVDQGGRREVLSPGSWTSCLDSPWDHLRMQSHAGVHQEPSRMWRRGPLVP